MVFLLVISISHFSPLVVMNQAAIHTFTVMKNAQFTQKTDMLVLIEYRK